jgi:hypothetical protein
MPGILSHPTSQIGTAWGPAEALALSNRLVSRLKSRSTRFGCRRRNRLWPLSREAFPKRCHKLTGRCRCFRRRPAPHGRSLWACCPSSAIISTGFWCASSSRKLARASTTSLLEPVHLAETYVTDGNFYWNAGIFLFSAVALLQLFEAHVPSILADCRRALSESVIDFEVRSLGESYAQARLTTPFWRRPTTLSASR